MNKVERITIASNGGKTMPYRSEAQRKFMHAVHPEIAKRWDREYGGKIVKLLKSRPKGKGRVTIHT